VSKKHRHRGKTVDPLAYVDQLEKLAPQTSLQIGKTPSGETERNVVTVRIRHKPVCWGFCFDEVTFSKWVVNMLRIPMMPWDSYATAQSTYLPDARNTVHSEFLQTDCEYLVMLDSDVLPPSNFLDALLKHHLPMVGGWYRKKGEPYPPCVYDNEQPPDENGVIQYKLREEPGRGLEEVAGAGAGCWLMHRSVAEAIGEKPYDMEHGGEDLALCRKVHAAGFKTWIDWSVACNHAGVALAYA